MWFAIPSYCSAAKVVADPENTFTPVTLNIFSVSGIRYYIAFLSNHTMKRNGEARTSSLPEGSEIAQASKAATSPWSAPKNLSRQSTAAREVAIEVGYASSLALVSGSAVERS